MADRFENHRKIWRAISHHHVYTQISGQSYNLRSIPVAMVSTPNLCNSNTFTRLFYGC